MPGSATLTRDVPARAETGTRTAPMLVALFVLATCLPIFLNLAGIVFTANRLISFITFVPALAMLLSGQAGRVRAPDILMIAAFFWTLPALFINDGVNADSLVFGGSQIVDFLGPYLLARVLIRNQADFVWLAQCLTAAVLIMAPFAVIESLTGVQPLRQIFEALPGIRTVREMQHNTRMGLERAQVTHEHPILYGLYSILAMSLAWCVLPANGSSRATGVIRTAAAVIGGFFSLSSAAVLGGLVQGGLIGYRMTMGASRRVWALLAGGLAFCYIALALISDRSPVMVIAYSLSHNANTAYNRLLIWRYGTDEVARNPIFGMGNFSEWIRAPWMSESIDNHWLLLAMRYGLPHILMYMGAIALILAGLMRLRCAGRPDLEAIRQALVYIILAVLVVLFTVLAWGGLIGIVMFLLGSAVWMLGLDPTVPSESAPPSPSSQPDRTLRYTRFPSGHGAPRSEARSRQTTAPLRRARPAQARSRSQS